MIRCPACQKLYSSGDSSCGNCGFAPEQVAGVPAWAPELASDGAAYRLEYFAKLAELEEFNFWFCARNALITWALKRYLPSARSFLEIGCGTGFVLSAISKAFPQARVSGSEISTTALEFAAGRIKHAQFMQMDARRMPFVAEFDAVGIFDVLEHIQDDASVLENIHEALNPEGVVLITVPQHPLLWSESDVHWSHVRRYTRREIEEKVQKAGFEIVRSTSFVSLLLPLMFASRYRGRGGKKYDPFTELKLNPLFNKALEFGLGIENAAIRAGVSFPAGGSRLVVARKGKK